MFPLCKIACQWLRGSAHENIQLIRSLSLSLSFLVHRFLNHRSMKMDSKVWVSSCLIIRQILSGLKLSRLLARLSWKIVSCRDRTLFFDLLLSKFRKRMLVYLTEIQWNLKTRWLYFDVFKLKMLSLSKCQRIRRYKDFSIWIVKQKYEIVF